ncbi:hypothetical protein DH2020_003512 [Rehmannia glutinosa]|uniref:Response regulatory domain-containing protein n=1 Tax=Rehmannia glutinosa TaxID=99300 RepID=A0ABR0XLT7_REHGL
MAKNGVFSRLRRLDRAEGVDDFSACNDSHEVHVLAVDDSLVDRKVIERLLKITSCKVTAVDSGRRALQFLGLDEEENLLGLKVDLIITDYCMPGMTGYELLKKSRIDRCLEEGAEDFIVKPVKLSDVKRLKSCMFGGNRIKKQDKGLNKRKLQDNSGVPLSPTLDDDDDVPSSPSPPSISSPSSPRSFSSLPSSPSSPTPPDSPTRRLKTSDEEE